MKNNKTISKALVSMSAVFALAMAASLPFTVKAGEPMKGAERATMMSQIKTEAQAEELKPGDTIAMVCSKCKSAMTHTVTTEKGHIKFMTIGEKHMCPGCSSTITVVGVGKQAKDGVKHVCQKCGSESVFCCATKPGSNASEGMEKK